MSQGAIRATTGNRLARRTMERATASAVTTSLAEALQGT